MLFMGCSVGYRAHGFGGSIHAHHAAQHQDPLCWLLIAELVSVAAGLHLVPCKVSSYNICRGTAALPDFQLYPLEQ